MMTRGSLGSGLMFAPENYAEALGEFYSRLFSSTGQDLRRLQSVLPPPPSDSHRTVVDLGCGQGRHFAIYSRIGYSHIVGIEFSDRLADEARNRARALGIDADVRRGDLFDIDPFSDADLVVVAGMTFTMFPAAKRRELLEFAASCIRDASSAVVIEFADRARVPTFVEAYPKWNVSLGDGTAIGSEQQFSDGVWYQTHSFPGTSRTATETHFPATFEEISAEARAAGFEADFATRARSIDSPESICQVAVLTPAARS